jgi:hypothetical protein
MSEPTRHATITDDGTGHGTIEVDGHDLSHAVTGYTIEGAVKRWTTLTLALSLQHGVHFDGEAVVVIRADTARALIAMGWEPPSATAAALDAGDVYVTEREPQ